MQNIDKIKIILADKIKVNDLLLNYISLFINEQILSKKIEPDLESFEKENKIIFVKTFKLVKEEQYSDFCFEIFEKLYTERILSKFKLKNEIENLEEQKEHINLEKPLRIKDWFNKEFYKGARKKEIEKSERSFGFEKLELIDKKKKTKSEKQKEFNITKYETNQWKKHLQEIILKFWSKTSQTTFNDIVISDYSMSTIDGCNTLLENSLLKFSKGMKYGLVGLNGVGKTTLLKRISRYDIKEIPKTTRILHVEQEIKGDDTKVMDYVLKSDLVREYLLNRKKLLIKRLENEDCQDNDIYENELQEIEEKISNLNLDKSKAKAGKILHGLGFDTKMQNTKTKNLSGGWRMRVSIACALFISPDLLLLDEPTNHLDFPSVLWLENYIKSYEKTVVIVSHDRHFLNNVITHVIHLYHKKINYYKGDYNMFEKVFDDNLINQKKAYEAQQKQIKHMHEFINRFRYNAKRASMVQSRIKTLRNLKRIPKTENDKKFKMNFPKINPFDRDIITIDSVYFGYSKEKLLLENINLKIDFSSRIGLMGANGVGKSTLLKLMMGFYQPIKGKVSVNESCKIAYFTQHHVDSLDLNKSAIENLIEKFDDEFPENINNKIQYCRSRLGQFGITQDLSVRQLHNLSGGQKSRVAFCMLVWRNPQLLILDEPTNHLDMETIDALIYAIKEFEGGLLVVSHDQYFLTKAVKKFWALKNGCLNEFESLEQIKKFVVE